MNGVNVSCEIYYINVDKMSKNIGVFCKLLWFHILVGLPTTWYNHQYLDGWCGCLAGQRLAPASPAELSACGRLSEPSLFDARSERSGGGRGERSA